MRAAEAPAAVNDDPLRRFSAEGTRVELKQIRHFLAVADAGNYARAAEGLGLTQSALTQSISRLEAGVGTRVLSRGRFGAALTEAGQMLYARAKLIVTEERLACLELEDFGKGSVGKVIVGAGKSAVPSLVPAALQSYTEGNPNVQLSVHEGWSTDLFAMLLRGELDLVVSAALPTVKVDADLTQELLYTEQEHLAIGPRHPLFGAAHVGLAELAASHWVLPPHGSGRARQVRRHYVELGLDPPSRFIRTDSLPVVMALLRTSAMVCFATPELAWHGQEPTPYRVIDLPGFALQRQAAITSRRRSRLTPAAQEFAAHVRRVAASLTRARHAA